MQSMKKDAEVVKEVTKNIKGVAIDIKNDTKDIKKNTESLQEDIKIIKGRQQNLEEQLRQIKKSVLEKTVENNERTNLSNTEESTFSELYSFTFFFALNVMNSVCEKFGVPSEHKNKCTANHVLLCCCYLLAMNFDGIFRHLKWL